MFNTVEFKVIVNNERDVFELEVPFVQKTIQCAGKGYFQSLIKRPQLSNVISDKLSESERIFENSTNDFEYLLSLDPTDCKNQDHYAVLGLKNLRYAATEADIKKAHRDRVLKYHPDKNEKLRENKKLRNTDYFTCITKAFEILSNPQTRRAYDSVDPTVDDSIPTNEQIKNSSNFYKLFNDIFEKNSHWSINRPVPKFGDENSTRNDVDNFYNFWYDFKSWREFSYLDEEDKQSGRDREERRWIEKQNKAVRQKRKAEEMQRIRLLVDLAYKNDERIIRFKEMEKEERLASKLARMSVKQQKKLEEEKAAKEMREALKKIEELEKAKIEEKRQQRELEKRALKKERKTLRDFVRNCNYFVQNTSDNMKNMEFVEKMCECFSLNDLAEANSNLTNSSNNPVVEFNKLIKKVKNLSMNDNQLSASNNSVTNNSNNNNNNELVNWNNTNITLLIKAINLFPAGTNNRWQVIANFLNQHTTNSGIEFKSKDVLTKAKSLQQIDFANTKLKTEINQATFQNSNKNAKRLSKDVTASTSTTVIPQPEDKAWSADEQRLLEQALKTYPSTLSNRWDKIAECVQTRSKKDCIKRYKELVEIIKAKKNATQLS